MKIFIDESVKDSNTYFFGAVLIDDFNIDEYRIKIKESRENLLHNPFFAKFLNIKSLYKSFHYTQDHREIKNIFLELLSIFSFEAIIYIYHDIDENEKVKKRIDFLKNINKFLNFRIKEKCYYIWEYDESLRMKWPDNIDIIEKKKEEEELISICDYVLGVFRKIYIVYLCGTGKYGISELRDYCKIETKIIFIKDSGNKKPYTRRNPLSIYHQ